MSEHCSHDPLADNVLERDERHSLTVTVAGQQNRKVNVRDEISMLFLEPYTE